MLTQSQIDVFLNILKDSLIKPQPPKRRLKWTEITKIALDFLEGNNEPYLREALEYLYKSGKKPVRHNDLYRMYFDFDKPWVFRWRLYYNFDPSIIGVSPGFVISHTSWTDSVWEFLQLFDQRKRKQYDN